MLQFQLRWLDDDKKAHARSLFYQYVSRPTVEQQTERESQPCSVSGSASLEDDLFCFDSQLANTADTRGEVDVYLTDTSRDIASLGRFPSVKTLFLKYNTALLSSAPVKGCSVWVVRF